MVVPSLPPEAQRDPSFDLEKKSKVDELKPEFVEKGKKSRDPECISLAWSADGLLVAAHSQ
jgi:hypothetical protein